MITWTHIDDPVQAVDPELPDSVARAFGEPFHSVVRKHLGERRTDPSHAFPRLEEHFGRYLFGHLHVPTSVDDGVPEFAELTVIASLDTCWTILRLPAGTEDLPTPVADRYRDRLRETRSNLASSVTVGVLLGRLFTITVNELEKVFETNSLNIAECSASLSSIESRHLSRAMKDWIPQVRTRATNVRREVASLGPVVDELTEILSDIVNDRLDLHSTTDRGELVELFGRETEIHLRDTYFRARRLKLLHDEQLEALGFIFDTIGHLNDADEVTSGRFMGAIASIMLLPTFIVGLYGMNFDSMPELHWPIGYGFAAFLIVATTVGQVWYFRKKRWI